MIQAQSPALNIIDRMRVKCGSLVEGELAALEELVAAYEKPGFSYHDLGLTKNESRFFHILLMHQNKVVEYDKIFSCIYFDRHSDQQPYREILKVYKCRVAEKVKHLGLTIEVVWGFGYILKGESYGNCSE